MQLSCIPFFCVPSRIPRFINAQSKSNRICLLPHLIFPPIPLLHDWFFSEPMPQILVLVHEHDNASFLVPHLPSVHTSYPHQYSPCDLHLQSLNESLLKERAPPS